MGPNTLISIDLPIFISLTFGVLNYYSIMELMNNFCHVVLEILEIASYVKAVLKTQGYEIFNLFLEKS